MEIIMVMYDGSIRRVDRRLDDVNLLIDMHEANLVLTEAPEGWRRHKDRYSVRTGDVLSIIDAEQRIRDHQSVALQIRHMGGVQRVRLTDPNVCALGHEWGSEMERFPLNGNKVVARCRNCHSLKTFTIKKEQT